MTLNAIVFKWLLLVISLQVAWGGVWMRRGGSQLRLIKPQTFIARLSHEKRKKKKSTPNPPSSYFPPHHIKGSLLLDALTLDVGTGRKLWSAVIHYTCSSWETELDKAHYCWGTAASNSTYCKAEKNEFKAARNILILFCWIFQPPWTKAVWAPLASRHQQLDHLPVKEVINYLWLW